MTSDKQVQVNRRNALKSTGPRTQEGKDRVRHNALTHGLLSQQAILMGEDEATLRELNENLRSELQPVGELENMLVDRVVSAHWRLARLGRVETGIFEHQTSNMMLHGSDSIDDYTVALGLTFIRDGNQANAFSKLSRYEAAIEKSLYKGLHELQRLQAARREGADVPPPAAVDIDVSGVSGEVT